MAKLNFQQSHDLLEIIKI